MTLVMTSAPSSTATASSVVFSYTTASTTGGRRQGHCILFFQGFWGGRCGEVQVLHGSTRCRPHPRSFWAQLLELCNHAAHLHTR